MTLKTLKDLKRIEDIPFDYVFLQELKAEAVKWVKEMSDDDDITPWMEFFNLTEEDLK